MFFKTNDECLKIADASGLNFDKKEKEILTDDQGWPGIIVNYGEVRFYKTHQLARLFASCLSHHSQTMLWITEFGVWASSENNHLYYRLRRSYEDFRAIYEAPGHLFLKHEQEDLITFTQLAILSGWGGYIFGLKSENFLAFSHDEYAMIFSKTEMKKITTEMKKFGFDCRPISEGK